MVKAGVASGLIKPTYTVVVPLANSAMEALVRGMLGLISPIRQCLPSGIALNILAESIEEQLVDAVRKISNEFRSNLIEASKNSRNAVLKAADEEMKREIELLRSGDAGNIRGNLSPA
jgi:hypothetical protein